MKNKIRTLVAMALLALISGCVGPYYKNQSQYEEGKWKGWADNNEVNQRSQQKLAIEKLQAQPVITGTMTATGVVATVVAPGTTAPAGYEGVVANFSSTQRYNFVIRGPEKKSFYLGPGEIIVDYLIPGEYTAAIYHGSSQLGPPQIFHVGVQIKIFQGKPRHWFVTADW